MANISVSRAQRLDQRVVEQLPEISRAFAAKLIDQGKVEVNGIVERKPGFKLKASDRVVVDYEPTELMDIPDIELEVLFEDDDCVVIHKPVGLLTHSKGGFNPEPTVATWLRSRLSSQLSSEPESSKTNRAGIVHRLDRATSGVMICAKNPEAMSWLQKQFAQRRVKKTYLAIIEGQLNPEAAIIDMPIERNPQAPATFRVGPHGKSAKTTYYTLGYSNNLSLLELKPETGRTHQLRVHLAHIGHPIVGDTFYSGAAADRLYLHAAELEITILAEHKRMVFSAPAPGVFTDRVQPA